MTAIQVMAELQAAGVCLWLDGAVVRYRAPQGVMTNERKAALVGHKAELLDHMRREVRWRIEAMGAQVPQHGAILLLVARPVPGLPPEAPADAAAPGRCLSCGEPALEGGARCGLCIAAVNQVLRDARTAREIGRRPENGERS